MPVFHFVGLLLLTMAESCCKMSLVGVSLRF
jgi:hypothetical protein